MLKALFIVINESGLPSAKENKESKSTKIYLEKNLIMSLMTDARPSAS